MLPAPSPSTGRNASADSPATSAAGLPSSFSPTQPRRLPTAVDVLEEVEPAGVDDQPPVALDDRVHAVGEQIDRRPRPKPLQSTAAGAGAAARRGGGDGDGAVDRRRRPQADCFPRPGSSQRRDQEREASAVKRLARAPRRDRKRAVTARTVVFRRLCRVGQASQVSRARVASPSSPRATSARARSPARPAARACWRRRSGATLQPQPPMDGVVVRRDRLIRSSGRLSIVVCPSPASARRYATASDGVLSKVVASTAQYWSRLYQTAPPPSGRSRRIGALQKVKVCWPHITCAVAVWTFDRSGRSPLKTNSGSLFISSGEMNVASRVRYAVRIEQGLGRLQRIDDLRLYLRGQLHRIERPRTTPGTAPSTSRSSCRTATR